MRLAPLLLLALALAAAGSRPAAAAPQTTAGPQAAVTGVEREALAIEAMLIAPCCFSQQVSIHESAATDEVRRDVRVRLASGATRQQILDAYVEQYGTRILAVPPPAGFDITLYAMPLGVFFVTAALGVFAIRRFAARGSAKAAEPVGPGAETASAADEARLDDELRDLD